MAKTVNERKAAERERMRARGFKLAQVWVHPLDWPAVREYIDRKNRKRDTGKSGEGTP